MLGHPVLLYYLTQKYNLCLWKKSMWKNMMLTFDNFRWGKLLKASFGNWQWGTFSIPDSIIEPAGKEKIGTTSSSKKFSRDNKGKISYLKLFHGKIIWSEAKQSFDTLPERKSFTDPEKQEVMSISFSKDAKIKGQGKYWKERKETKVHFRTRLEFFVSSIL